MIWDDETLINVYDKTDGYCHICGKKLSFINYGIPGKKGAWQVDHSKPKAKGGSDHPNNLYPACISCNLEKSDYLTRTARRWNGRKNAPLSKVKKRLKRRDNTIYGAIIGGTVGSIVGPGGTILGATIGAFIGSDKNPDSK